ncbi:hypothetical protein HZH66_009833 [Vespula vulgaris]|uniref:Uncharacterized protein n=1 Tax=Vespula vulgaris TaxID=7454 RepID=A0A834N221_VESVU|nr:hypothetical protein HZH66_009833 [Vespula vulgaris]
MDDNLKGLSLLRWLSFEFPTCTDGKTENRMLCFDGYVKARLISLKKKKKKKKKKQKEKKEGTEKKRENKKKKLRNNESRFVLRFDYRTTGAVSASI